LAKYETAARLSVTNGQGGRADAEDKIGIDWGDLRARIGSIAIDQAELLADAQAGRVNKHNQRDMNRILGLDLNAEPKEVRRALDAFRRENVALIKSIAVDLHADVRNVVRQAVSKGTRVEDLRAELMERFGVSESRADLIARDQTLKANADLSKLRHEEAGITRYVWSTSKDERVRPMHSALEGRVFKYSDEPPVTNEKGDRNRPGQDYQCRCVALAILDDLPVKA
jgi:SPP1 gp7 family putative phage head morphogenesis protein